MGVQFKNSDYTRKRGICFDPKMNGKKVFEKNKPLRYILPPLPEQILMKPVIFQKKQSGGICTTVVTHYSYNLSDEYQKKKKEVRGSFCGFARI